MAERPARLGSTAQQSTLLSGWLICGQGRLERKEPTLDITKLSSIQAAPSCWGSAASDAAASNEVRKAYKTRRQGGQVRQSAL